MINLDIHYKTVKGIKREINEDSILSEKFGNMQVMAVADGLGGHAAGEIASHVAIRELKKYLNNRPPLNGIVEIMRDTIAKVNTAIFQLSQENRSYRGMASTLVIAIITPEESFIANVGDSRAYLIGSTITRVTKDHSLVQELLDQKKITQEESFGHVQRNLITLSLGTRKSINPDFYNIDLSGKILLLCSDGLSDSLRDEDIRSIITGYSTLEEACNHLIELAQKKRGTDDITVLLAKEVQRVH